MRDLYPPDAVVAAVVAEHAALLEECRNSDFPSLFLHRAFVCRPMGDDGHFQLRCHLAFASPALDHYRAQMRSWLERLLPFVPPEHRAACVRLAWHNRHEWGE